MQRAARRLRRATRRGHSEKSRQEDDSPSTSFSSTRRPRRTRDGFGLRSARRAEANGARDGTQDSRGHGRNFGTFSVSRTRRSHGTVPPSPVGSVTGPLEGGISRREPSPVNAVSFAIVVAPRTVNLSLQEIMETARDPDPSDVDRPGSEPASWCREFAGTGPRRTMTQGVAMMLASPVSVRITSRTDNGAKGGMPFASGRAVPVLSHVRIGERTAGSARKAHVFSRTTLSTHR